MPHHQDMEICGKYLNYLQDVTKFDASPDQKIVHVSRHHPDYDHKFEKTRWTVIDAVHMDKIQAVEQSQAPSSYVEVFPHVRCTLCQVRAGDAVTPWDLRHHLLDE
jgi:hypothetical protein